MIKFYGLALLNSVTIKKSHVKAGEYGSTMNVGRRQWEYLIYDRRRCSRINIAIIELKQLSDVMKGVSAPAAVCKEHLALAVGAHHCETRCDDMQLI